ncbi:MAG: radical SAM protein [Candidatus Omnitrophota bacterium]
MRFNRILLVFPRFSKGRYQLSIHPPSGLGYVAEALKCSGKVVSVFDMNLQYNYKDLEKRIADFKPDLIGFSVMTFGYKETYSFIHRVKTEHGGIKIVAGGPHISTLRKKVLHECVDIDYGIIMEGDRSIVQLCGGEDLQNIKGFMYRRDRDVVVNPFETFIKNLDSLSFPKYESFELSKYPTRQIGVVTSRGCPYECIYCPVIAAIGKEFRQRSAHSVVEEIVYWYDKGYRDILLLDDNFTLSRERVEDICDLLFQKKMENIRLKCPNGIRADRVDYKLLKRMKEIGFDMIAFGVEAAADHVLKNIKKGESFATIEESVKNACRLGFDVDLFFLIGSPGETVGDVEKSFSFALRYPVRSAKFYNIIPFPTTELYQWIKEKKLFLHPEEHILNNASHFINEPCFYTPEMSVRERKRMFLMGQKVTRKIRRKHIERNINIPRVLRPLASRILVSSFVDDVLVQNRGIAKTKEKLKKVFVGNKSGNLCA